MDYMMVKKKQHRHYENVNIELVLEKNEVKKQYDI
jgi:hypothetical protein